MIFKCRNIRRVCAVVLLLCLMLTGCGAPKQEIRFGTGGSGGTYFSYIKQFSEESTSDYNILVKSTAGSAANLRLLQKGTLDAAVVQSDILYSAEQGTGLFEGEKIGDKRSYSAVTGLYTETLQIVVREDAGINSVSDLKGKEVSVGAEGSGVIQNARQILELYGLTFKDLETHNLSFGNAANAMRSGTLDAFFCVAGVSTPAIEALSRDIRIRILSLADQDVRQLVEQYPGYEACTIPSGTYDGQQEEVHTIGVRAMVVVSDKLDNATVKAMVKDFFRYSKELNQNIVTDGELTAEKAVQSIPIPFHPGAAEYLTQKGAAVNVSGK